MDIESNEESMIHKHFTNLLVTTFTIYMYIYIHIYTMFYIYTYILYYILYIYKFTSKCHSWRYGPGPENVFSTLC